MNLPMARVRQIINMDPESIAVSKEALVLISKATEAFVQDFGGVIAQVAKTQKRKTLLVDDVKLAVESVDRFHFIAGKFFSSAVLSLLLNIDCH